MTKMKNGVLRAAVAVALFYGGAAAAQTLTMTDPSGASGSQQSVQFNYTAGGDVSVIIFQTDLADANAIVGTPVFQQFDAGTSTFVNCDGTTRFASFVPTVQIQCTAGGLYTVQGSAPTAAVGSFSNVARVQFTLAGADGQTATYSYAPNCAAGEFPNTDNCTEFTNTSAARVVGDVSDPGLVTVQALPPDANLVYAPASGSTITFGGGTSGDTVTSSIAVTATGTAGSGDVTGCSLGGANPGAFAITNVFPVTATVGGSGGSIDLECTLGNAASTATLSCTETDSSVSNPTWNLSCPAGTAVPAPEFDSTPAAGTQLNCNGAPGATTSTSVTVANTGFAGVGSDLTFTCSATGTGFTVTAPAGGTDTIAVGESSVVSIQCTVPLDGAAATGTLTCTSNDADEGAGVDFPLSAGIVTAPPPVPQPAVIPANSLWSLLALFGVMAGLGALVIGVRRH